MARGGASLPNRVRTNRPYHRAVERALGAASVPFVKVNPCRARRFAEATGKLAKTDRLDAAILACRGALLELETRPARSEILLELKQLYVAREALVKDRTAAKNRRKALTVSLLKRQNVQRLEQIDRQIATVEGQDPIAFRRFAFRAFALMQLPAPWGCDQ
jgi:transposase